MIRKIIAAILVIIAIGYAGVLATIYSRQQTLLYPGASEPPVALPSRPGWGDTVSIRTPDGQTLAALYQPAAVDRPTVLFFHGNGNSIAGYRFLAEAFQTAGIGLLAVSYRGYPGSTGRATEDGLLIDGLAGYDWLRAKIAGPIALMGRSLGTGVAINIAAEREATGIVLVSPYESVVAVAKRRFWYLPVGLLIRDSFRSDLRIGGVTEPKLFLHGDRDEVVPLASGEALYALAPEPKHLSIQAGLHHNDIWSPAVLGEIIAFVSAPK